jgi:hypothetical protein
MAKTKRAPYRGSKRISKGCRNHGTCPWCARGRQHRNAKAEAKAKAGEVK